MAKNQIIDIIFQGIEIGKLDYDENERKSSFQYNPEFIDSGKLSKIFPYIIRRTKSVQVFSTYEGETFRGLPPMIADSLPDLFGNIIFKEWLEANHKDLAKISPLEQLTYVANRGMGALEYFPAKETPAGTTINIEEMAEVVRKVLDFKIAVEEKGLSEKALLNIFKIGTSAGGARPKILVSENKESKKLIPGDIEISENYNHYLIKLSINEDSYSKEKIEYIYYKIATSLGIDMMFSKLIDDKHFATLRFDRQYGEKQHILTASGLVGWDFKKSENSTYENLFTLAVDLGSPHKDILMLFKRMVFNVVFANIDDHLKNFSFIYNKEKNRWNLAPAYDLTYPLDALMNYLRTSRALSLNGKRNNISKSDILKIADQFTIKDAENIIQNIVNATENFRPLCEEHNIPKKAIEAITKEFVLF